MTASPERDREVKRPSRAEAASSPTSLSNLIASAMLLAGFFLPHSVACDDRSHRPATITKAILTESREPGELLALATMWPFAFAGLTLLVMIAIVLARPRWFDRALLALPMIVASMLTLTWILFLFSGTAGSRMAMTVAATTVPVAACVAARMIWLYRSGSVAAAATWGQGLICVLAAFSLRWFWFPPVTRLLWGGVLSIGSALLMMAASWFWITRARHDLYDRSTKPQPFQVSLRQIILAIALAAIALSYWRVFESQ